MRRPPASLLRLLTGAIVALAALMAPACASQSPAPRKAKKTVLMTSWDERDAGAAGARQVEAETGLLGDPALDAYVDEIGRRLLRGIPSRRFQYRFRVVDMQEPNAFALPGGYVFVSRGLLALAASEDELACVIGHEIVHVARSHSAAQQALATRGLAVPWMRAAEMAAYGREMEREADKYGQILCAAAGYDPMAMSTFLARLDQVQRLELGYLRGQSFFDTHPGSTERAGGNAARASELRWKPDPALGDEATKLARLRGRSEGLALGQRPETGIFRDREFLHPALDFRLLFPGGWLLRNANMAVGAMAPRRDAVVFLMAGAASGDPREAAEAWVAATREEGQRFQVAESKPVRIGSLDAWRMKLEGGGATSYVTFISYRGATWRITGSSAAVSAGRYLPSTLNTTRSFRPLTAEERASLTRTRLHWMQARPGETVEALASRSGGAWDPNTLAVFNGVFVHHRFQGGEWVKTARVESYTPQPPVGG